MKHKKLIIVLAVVGVMAVAATAAYAWWTSSDSLEGNTIATGTMGIDVQGQSGPINVTGLVPSYGPNIDVNTYVWALSKQDVASENNFPSWFFYIHNTGDVPEMFYAWAQIVDDPAGIAGKVMCRIWLNPEDYPGTHNPSWWKYPNTYAVWQGPLSDIDSALEGTQRIRSIDPGGVYETLPAGTAAVYKIVFWLDSSADNTYQGKTLNAILHVKGGQEEAWPF